MASTQNLASGTLAADVTSSSTTLSVLCGTGSVATLSAIWPDTPFYVTVMPTRPVAGVANSLDSEVMRVTALSVANEVVTLTVTRGQKNTTAKAFSEGAIVTNGIYMDDILNRIYPVGSIYMSATMSTHTQVEEMLGGTWTAFGAGRVPVGVDATQTEFNSVLKIGGSKTHSHPLGANGAAAVRNYGDRTFIGNGANTNSLWKMDGSANDVWSWTHNTDDVYADDLGYSGVRLYGQTEETKSLPPYITCYMYRRTA